MLGRIALEILDRSIPSRLSGAEDRLRARLIQVMFGLGSLAFIVAGLMRTWLHGAPTPTHVLFTALFASGTLVLPLTANLRLSAALALSIGFAGIVLNSVEAGGYVPILSWSAVCTMGAVYLIGVRGGLALFLAFTTASACIAAAHWLGALGPFDPSVIDPKRSSLGWTIIQALQTAMALAFASFYASEHRALMVELDRARAEAERSNRLKSTFLATMSHEIRTPMNGVLAAADLLRRGDLPADERALAELIYGSGEALLDILNDILDFSKIEAGKVELEQRTFDPRALVEAAVELLQPRAREKGLLLSLELEGGLPEAVRGDPARLRQVVLNLLSNAVKFTAQGRVVVQVSAPRPGEVHLSVEDTGPGMSEAELARLFQPFTQADRSVARLHGGTGLGLAISQRLVRAMGGRIDVTSCPGHGSRFFFTLPLPAAQVGAEVEQPPQPPVTAPVAGAILVVDDNEVNRIVAVKLVGRLGLEVRAVASAEEALASIARDRFALVLMDREMPGMDGEEATRRVRRAEVLPGALPIVALTASALHADHEACLAAGMNAVLTKPVTLAALSQCVERWARRVPASGGQGAGVA